jgi:hypothetical protein
MEVNVLKGTIKLFISILAIAGAICLLAGIEDEEFLIAGYSILGVAVVLWINYALSTYFYHVATEKGYYESCYLWIPFLFSAVGYVLVAALPDRGNGTKTVSKSSKNKDSYAEIAKYKELLDSEIITQEEFDAKKKQILGL